KLITLLYINQSLYKNTLLRIITTESLYDGSISLARDQFILKPKMTDAECVAIYSPSILLQTAIGYSKSKVVYTLDTDPKTKVTKATFIRYNLHNLLNDWNHVSEITFPSGEKEPVFPGDGKLELKQDNLVVKLQDLFMYYQFQEESKIFSSLAPWL